ncbi:hypothetical protein ACHAXT_008745 [Thalassiosira profunda]
MKLLHPAATIFLDHLLSGIAEENEKIQASIDRFLPVRDFVESDEKSDRHVDCPEPNFDVGGARFAIVEALSSSDSQLELVSENLRLKTELSRLNKAAEVLGSLEISNGIGGKATLSLQDGRFVHQNGIPTWFLAENLDMPYADLSSIECVVSGVPLQPDPMLDADATVHGAFMKRFCNGATLFGFYEADEESSKRITRAFVVLPFETVENVLSVLGIYDSEDDG